MADRKYLKYDDSGLSDIYFPDEISLCFEIREDGKNELTDDCIEKEIIKYKKNITCIGLIGGDYRKSEVVNIAKHIKSAFEDLRVGWYSDEDTFPLFHGVFDYIKLGKYDETLGGLSSPTTNMRFYINTDSHNKNYLNARFADVTKAVFQKKIEQDDSLTNPAFSREDIKKNLDEE